jgi:hypothetical protein
MFAPVIEADLEFMSLAFAVAICGLLCVEYLRSVSALPYRALIIDRALNIFQTKYTAIESYWEIFLDERSALSLAVSVSLTSHHR